MKRKYTIIILILNLLLTDIGFSTNINKKFIGEKIIFTDNILPVKNSNVDFLNDSRKILIIMNGNCSICINNLRKINSLYLKKLKDKPVKFYVIAYGNYYETFHYLIKDNSYDFPLFFDQNKKFIKLNKIKKNKAKVIFLSENNKITHYSKEFNNKTFESLYEKF